LNTWSLSDSRRNFYSTSKLHDVLLQRALHRYDPATSGFSQASRVNQGLVGKFDIEEPELEKYREEYSRVERLLTPRSQSNYLAPANRTAQLETRPCISFEKGTKSTVPPSFPTSVSRDQELSIYLGIPCSCPYRLTSIPWSHKMARRPTCLPPALSSLSSHVRRESNDKDRGDHL